MVSLVNMRDQLTAAQSIEYLKRIVDCQKRVGAPGDDVGVIFDKIQAWKQKYGDFEEQERHVSKVLLSKGIMIHNVKTLLAKLREI
jgi:hypothetical protein